MTALACLRVDVSAYAGQMPMPALEQLVHKFASAYLETRWSWPRRFAPLSEVSFLLTDPRSAELDVGELRRLSDELQRHLFGAGDDGEVALLVFEGPHTAVTAFAGMDAALLAKALGDPALLPAGGRLTRILPAACEPAPEAPATRSEESGWMASPAAQLRRLASAPPPPPPPAWEGVQGVYFIPRELFYGDVAMYVPQNSKSHLSVLDGFEHMPRDPPVFDAACVGIAVRILSQRTAPGSPLYVPICFTSLVRPSQREAYAEMLARLPPERRSELMATVYDVPRDPVFTGLRQVRALLTPYFSAIDLRTSDPGFEIEKLPPEAVTSVTLVLPDGDGHIRLSAMRQFSERLSHYRQRRIWPGVSNIRRRAELEAAPRLHIPFVTGPGVCSPVPSPVGGRTLSLSHLPMTLAEWMDKRDDALAAADVRSA